MLFKPHCWIFLNIITHQVVWSFIWCIYSHYIHIYSIYEHTFQHRRGTASVSFPTVTALCCHYACTLDSSLDTDPSCTRWGQTELPSAAAILYLIKALLQTGARTQPSGAGSRHLAASRLSTADAVGCRDVQLKSEQCVSLLAKICREPCTRHAQGPWKYLKCQMYSRPESMYAHMCLCAPDANQAQKHILSRVKSWIAVLTNIMCLHVHQRHTHTHSVTGTLAWTFMSRRRTFTEAY